MNLINLCRRLQKRMKHWFFHTPTIDIKTVIIIMLLLDRARRGIVYATLFNMGAAQYPTPINATEIMRKPGEMLANAYTQALSTTIDHGYRFGEILYPWNQKIALAGSYLMLYSVYAVVIYLLISSIKLLVRTVIDHRRKKRRSQ